MALTIEDLKPQSFTITVKGVDLTCKPPRLSHILVISKVGEAFKDVNKLSRKEIAQTQEDFDWVIDELVPEIAGIELEMQESVDVLTQIMEHISPAENRELTEKGVSLGVDPKVEKIG